MIKIGFTNHKGKIVQIAIPKESIEYIVKAEIATLKKKVVILDD